MDLQKVKWRSTSLAACMSFLFYLVVAPFINGTVVDMWNLYMHPIWNWINATVTIFKLLIVNALVIFISVFLFALFILRNEAHLFFVWKPKLINRHIIWKDQRQCRNGSSLIASEWPHILRYACWIISVYVYFWQFSVSISKNPKIQSIDCCWLCSRSRGKCDRNGFHSLSSLGSIDEFFKRSTVWNNFMCSFIKL